MADARFAKPLDETLIRQLAENHEVLITIEEGSVGGFGAFVLHFLSREGLLDGLGTNALKIRTLTLPDTYQDQASPKDMYIEAGLQAEDIARCVMVVLGEAGQSTANLRA